MKKLLKIIFWIKVVIDCRFSPNEIASSILNLNGVLLHCCRNNDGSLSVSRSFCGDRAYKNISKTLWQTPLILFSLWFCLCLFAWSMYSRVKLDPFSPSPMFSYFGLGFGCLILLYQLLSDIPTIIRFSKMKMMIRNDDGSSEETKDSWYKNKNTLCYIKQDNSYGEINV